MNTNSHEFLLLHSCSFAFIRGPLPPFRFYQLNLNRTWIWRGRMFWVETVAGMMLPKF
jgi:hypothetical protein